MSDISSAIDNLIKRKIAEGFIQCENKKHQESVRVMAFNVKRKLPKHIGDEIAVTKVTVEDENSEDVFFVKVYMKPISGFFVLDDETGKMVKFKEEFDPETDAEVVRTRRLMVEDGKSPEDIKETIDALIEERKKEKAEGFKPEQKAEAKELKDIEVIPENRNTEKEEMKRLREEKK